MLWEWEIALGFSIVIIQGILLGYFIGSKRRLGAAWSIFLNIFLPGFSILFLFLSPPIKQQIPYKTKDKPYNIILAIVCLIGVFGYTRELINVELYPLYVPIAIAWRIIGLTGLALYLFIRHARHKKLYEKFKTHQLSSLIEAQTSA